MVSKLIARWHQEGEAAFESKSRRPKTSPTALPSATIEAIVNLRANLHEQGLDHGPATIAWHLHHHHGVSVSRHDRAHPGPAEPGRARPEETTQVLLHPLRSPPNETWQSDFTHWRLADDTDIETLAFLDDCTRYALSVTIHPRVTGPVVLDAFRSTVREHGEPPWVPSLLFEEA